jgi:TPR repeat protein
MPISEAPRSGVGLGLLALAMTGAVIAGAVGSALAQGRVSGSAQSLQSAPLIPQRHPVFTSPQAAFEQGMSSLRGGFFEIAIPALRYAADHELFLAQFYLARTLADSGTAYTDHASAYQIYRKIAVDHAHIDPDDDQRRPFVAKALTALALYVRHGLPQIQLRADPARAVEYLRHAAQFFNDEEAQFELGKTYLQGDGVAQDTRAGLHWLSVLTQRGHAGAQALLADIYWRGRYKVARDPTRAFALISVAVENAPDSERVWIEDIYHNIFCGAPAGTRTQAQGMVADWRQRYGRTVQSTSRTGLGGSVPQAERTCSNGESVKLLPPRSQVAPPQGPATPTLLAPAQANGVVDIGVTGSAFVPR